MCSVCIRKLHGFYDYLWKRREHQIWSRQRKSFWKSQKDLWWSEYLPWREMGNVLAYGYFFVWRFHQVIRYQKKTKQKITNSLDYNWWWCKRKSRVVIPLDCPFVYTIFDLTYMKILLILQEFPHECGVACLAMIGAWGVRRHGFWFYHFFQRY